MQKTLGRYGITYMNYLKEYKKEMYKVLKENDSLLDHCYGREQELEQLYKRVDKQLRIQYPRPNTIEFIKVAQYENKIASMVNEIVLDNIRF